MVTLGLAAAACTARPTPSARTAPPVLGAQPGTPAVTGQPAPSGTDQLAAVSCSDAEHCWAAGAPGPGAATVIDATVDGGLTWAAQSVPHSPSPALSGISCPDARYCMTVGSSSASPATGVVLTTNDGGGAWVDGTVPSNAIDVISVECASVADCTVIAGDGTHFWSDHSVDFGHSWQREGDLPVGLVDTGNMSCTAAGICFVAGYSATTTGHGQGAIVVSVDGGVTWTAADVPAGTGLLHSVTCATATNCLAAGTTATTVSDVVPARGELLHSSDSGHTWTTAATTPPVDDVQAIDCPERLVCAMVGTRWIGRSTIGTGAAARSKNGGVSFAASTTAYTPLGLAALACPTAAQCISVGGDTVARITLPQVKKVGSRTHHRSSH
jgi:hypothetical protein